MCIKFHICTGSWRHNCLKQRSVLHLHSQQSTFWFKSLHSTLWRCSLSNNNNFMNISKEKKVFCSCWYSLKHITSASLLRHCADFTQKAWKRTSYLSIYINVFAVFSLTTTVKKKFKTVSYKCKNKVFILNMHNQLKLILIMYSIIFWDK